MYTFGLIDGDLVLNAGSYFTYSGPDKIRQDLTIALHEEYGGDRNHPYWGTVLDRYIGQPISQALQTQVVNETSRVVKNYILAQTDQVNADISAGVKGRYGTGDVVQSVTSVTANASYDSINVSVTLQAMNNQTVTVNRKVIA